MLLNRRVPPEEGAGERGWGITTTCKNIPKLLSVLDFLYSDEGGLMRNSGLTKEQIPASDTSYAAVGMQDGTYWFDSNGSFVYNPLLTYAGGSIDPVAFIGTRLPGYNRNAYQNQYVSEGAKKANDTWSLYDDGSSKRKLPSVLYYGAAEERVLRDRTVTITDYVDSLIPKYIMGTESFNETVWEQFKRQLITYGLEDSIRIQQEAYDRYLKR
jgi:putative aldouronate transport system substrate-binding protein